MFISDSHPIKAFREILAEIATVRDIEATASFPTDDRHHASVEQIDLTAAGHLTFDELELGALSLRLAVRPSGVIAATTAALSLAMPLAKRRILHLIICTEKSLSLQASAQRAFCLTLTKGCATRR